jgi:hypothetical protein
MKHKNLWLVGLLALSTTGCNGMNNTQADALGGGILGAGLGALIGGPRHALAGAAIGGAMGAGSGALVGNAEDQRDKRRQDYAIAAANAQAARQMSLNDVVQMSQQKVPDQIIVNQMNTSGSWFDLKTDDILNLRQQGVSDYIVSQMQVRRGPTAVMVPRRVVYVDPYAPPPPPPVGVGVVIAR